MHYYKIYGLHIQSEYEFEEVMPVEQSDCMPVDVTISEGEIPAALTQETELDEKEGVTYLHRFEKQWGWMRVKGQGCFVIEQGRKITYQLKQECDRMKINQILLGFVMAVTMIQRGMLAIHGSGILMGNKAVIISGNSGAGKSTLTAAFLNKSGKFIADDTVAIKLKEGKPYAQPAYPQQKICVDSLQPQDKERGSLVLLPALGKKEKYGLRLHGGYCTEEQELSAMFILQAGDVDSVQLQEITGSEKIRYLTDNIFKRGIYLEVGMPQEVFKQCIQVANQVKIYSLIRPREGMTTDIQMERIMEALNEEADR